MNAAEIVRNALRDVRALLAERDQLAAELDTTGQALALAIAQLNDAHARIRAAEAVLDDYRGGMAEYERMADDVHAALRGDR